jgi:hypothetical protein
MTFALITEGPSEYRVIKHIISKYFKELGPDINQIQPKIVNDKQETVGGWHEVLKYCERDALKAIFVENDYLIIQIDSDQSQTAPYSVSHTKNDNSLKTVVELHADIVTKLTSLIKPDILEAYSDKVFFAICIHTIECWLLPLYYTNNYRLATGNCLTKLNSILRRKNLGLIPTKDKNSPQAAINYEVILKNLRRRQDVIDISVNNDGFQMFINSLNRINVHKKDET